MFSNYFVNFILFLTVFIRYKRYCWKLVFSVLLFFGCLIIGFFFVKLLFICCCIDLSLLCFLKTGYNIAFLFCLLGRLYLCFCFILEIYSKYSCGPICIFYCLVTESCFLLLITIFF